MPRSSTAKDRFACRLQPENREGSEVPHLASVRVAVRRSPGRSARPLRGLAAGDPSRSGRNPPSTTPLEFSTFGRGSELQRCMKTYAPTHDAEGRDRPRGSAALPCSPTTAHESSPHAGPAAGGDRARHSACARSKSKRIFDMSRAGHGCRDKTPAWGKGKWEEAYIRKNPPGAGRR